MRDHFVRRYGAHRAGALGSLIEESTPGLVVCDEVDVGAVVAAEQHAVPCVTVNVIAAGRLMAADVVGAAWDDLRRAYGLAADSGGARLGGDLSLAPLPRSFRDPVLPWPGSLHAVRPPILEDVGSTRSSSLVYATLGTVFNVESGDLLERLAAALGQVGGESILAVGSGVRPDELGPIAPGVRVEPFVDQREILGRCRAIVCHGGSGTLIAALSLGVPVVVLPMGADQPDNADRVEALGAGIVLDPVTATPGTIAEAVREAAADQRYATAATELAAEAAAQPAPGDLSELASLIG
jgi:UDP:flavonoid glycosyltransferase YjiC (YdhE family)